MGCGKLKCLPWSVHRGAALMEDTGQAEGRPHGSGLFMEATPPQGDGAQPLL